MPDRPESPEERLSGALTWIADRAGRIADGSYTAEGAGHAAAGIRERAISALAALSTPNEPAGNLDHAPDDASSVGRHAARHYDPITGRRREENA